MDIIYSRKKLSIKKKYLIILLLLLLVIIFGSLIRKIAYPTFENLCKNRAIALAAKILNDETDITMKDYSYEDLVKVEKDNEGNVQLIDINIFVLNDIISHITENTQDEILKNRREVMAYRSESEDDNYAAKIAELNNIYTNILNQPGEMVYEIDNVKENMLAAKKYEEISSEYTYRYEIGRAHV